MYLYTGSLGTNVISLPAIGLGQTNVLLHMPCCSEISHANPLEDLSMESLINSAQMLGQRVHSWCCGSDPHQLIPQVIRPANLPEARFSFSILQSAWQHPQNSPEQQLVNGTYRNVNALILVSISKIKLATPLGPASICLLIINEERESYLCYSVMGIKKRTHYRETLLKLQLKGSSYQ